MLTNATASHKSAEQETDVFECSEALSDVDERLPGLALLTPKPHANSITVSTNQCSEALQALKDRECQLYLPTVRFEPTLL